eukprot:PhM_4_TR16848/c0_g1_i1/m.43243/K08339/ATG5; autophagy-related protein 5
MDDDTISHNLCEGTIPVRFQLSTRDAVDTSAPPVVLSVPRNSYLPLHKQILLDTFAPHISTMPGVDPALWLEIDGQPIPWHLPMGVVADVHCAKHAHDGTHAAALPLRVTVNFSNFPTQSVVAFSEKNFEMHFRHTLKAAVCCRWDRLTPFQQNPQPSLFSDTDEMLKASEPSVVTKVHRCIRDYAGPLSRLPVVVYRVSCGGGAAGSVPTTTSRMYGVEVPGPETTFAAGLAALGVAWDRATSVTVQGLEPPPETPWLFVLDTLVYADMCCHIVVNELPSKAKLPNANVTRSSASTSTPPLIDHHVDPKAEKREEEAQEERKD